MSVLEKTEVLCQELVDSPEYQELVKWEIYIQNDPDAMDLVKEYNSLQKQVQLELPPGKSIKDVMGKLNELNAEMKADETVYSYVKAQQQFEKLLGQVHTIINSYIETKDSSNNFSTSCNCQAVK